MPVTKCHLYFVKTKIERGIYRKKLHVKIASRNLIYIYKNVFFIRTPDLKECSFICPYVHFVFLKNNPFANFTQVYRSYGRVISVKFSIYDYMHVSTRKACVI